MRQCYGNNQDRIQNSKELVNGSLGTRQKRERRKKAFFPIFLSSGLEGIHLCLPLLSHLTIFSYCLASLCLPGAQRAKLFTLDPIPSVNCHP